MTNSKFKKSQVSNDKQLDASFQIKMYRFYWSFNDLFEKFILESFRVFFHVIGDENMSFEVCKKRFSQ